MAIPGLVQSQSWSKDTLKLQADVAEFVKKHLPDDTYEHSVRVANYAQTDEERIVALLHDVVEDGHATVDDLYDLGMPSPLVTAVCILTRDPDPTTQTYDDYIGLMLTYLDLDTPGARVAARVKMYDIFDHLHPHLVGNIKPKRVERYIEALRKLALAQAKKSETTQKQGNALKEVRELGASFKTIVENHREAATSG